MAWNQPGNNGQDNDPWGNGNQKKPNNSSGSFFDMVNNLFKKKKSGGKNNYNLPVNMPVIIGAILLIIIIIWAISGFYTINQSQRGVVTRFGQVQQEIVQPGLNWKPSLIDQVYIVDTQGTRNFNVQGFMITAGENLVFVEMNVQYQVSNPIKYLFNVTNVEDSLRQAADSALRTEVGSSNMDAILTDGRSALESRTKDELVNIISNYDMGIRIVDLNFQSVRPPEEVQDAFNDAIKAREDREREINKAEADKVQLIQQSEGRSARILADANAYRVRVELEAEGDVARFEKLLPEYKAAPEITKERLYIETMEHILSNTNKILVNDKSGNLLVLPLEQLLKNKDNSNPSLNEQFKLNSTNGYNMNFPSTSNTDAVASTSESKNTNVTRGNTTSSRSSGR
ncbi:membrane protease subunit HflK [Orbus hercynius]|uniref:Protein HflK n=1 Tax=Orbus hercynius TaxID=593135 RepID=A0A495RB44_9GAMM|nr:FtsH protease activity modulator HflK [Orbus hercynius]RKS84480.1 membrane protease subunit HflK [Orbus hercynius]